MELRCDNIQYSIEGSRILNGISLGVIMSFIQY